MYRRILPAAVILLTILIWVSASYAQKVEGGLGIGVSQLYDPSSENKIGALVVVYVLEGTPAQTSGIRAGDFITHINGKPTAGRELETLALKELRGPVGTWVRLTVERGPSKQILDISLPRLAMPSVK
jgi:carboxyl-terminal processing protease